MNTNKVEYSKVGHVGYITFSGAPDPRLGAELTEIAAGINGDEAVYAVIVRATDDFFEKGAGMAGSEQNDLSAAGPAAAIGEINRPTVAAVRGDAIGRGLEIALACDIRVGVESARFGLAQIKDGQIPSDGGTQRLARLVGKGKALEMILTGELMAAPEALETGLVNRVVSAAALESEIESLAAAMVSKAPLAMRFCKEAVNKGLDMTLEQGLKLEADLYFLLHTTSDRTEGVQSYLQKRKPEYQGK